MKSTISIRRVFNVLLLATFVLTGMLVGAALMAKKSGNALEAATVSRYQSFLLADELRQSSDDLTRLARTYVVSGDAKWEQQYFEVLDIRNGKKPRPSPTSEFIGTSALRTTQPTLVVQAKPSLWLNL